jgi:hypothetical protein
VGTGNLFFGFGYIFITIVSLLVKREKTFVHYLLLFGNWSRDNFVLRLFLRSLKLVLLCKISWDYIIERVSINYHREDFRERVTNRTIPFLTFKFTQFNKVI